MLHYVLDQEGGHDGSGEKLRMVNSNGYGVLTSPVWYSSSAKRWYMHAPTSIRCFERTEHPSIKASVNSSDSGWRT